jgi:hypothetical protein
MLVCDNLSSHISLEVISLCRENNSEYVCLPPNSSKDLLPNAFEKCGLAPINRHKVLNRIPSILKSQCIASHVDQVLLEKLEVRRFWDGKTKKVRGKKVTAGGSFSTQEEEEVVDQFIDEEMVSGSDEEMGVEETELKS